MHFPPGIKISNERTHLDWISVVLLWSLPVHILTSRGGGLTGLTDTWIFLVCAGLVAAVVGLVLMIIYLLRARPLSIFILCAQISALMTITVPFIF
jgi:hypothetical protein